MEMEYVTKEFCNERHGHTKDERATLKGRVTEHGKEIEALQKVADHQTSSIENIMRRLENIDARLSKIEDKPRKRWEQVVSKLVDWATLLVLGLIAAKIGL